MNDGTCETCKYFESYGIRFWEGTCTRFPKWEEANDSHYCGEYSGVRKMAKAYCLNMNCPFHDCDKHMKQLEGKGGTYTFAGFDATCRRYITWLLRGVKKDG